MGHAHEQKDWLASDVIIVTVIILLPFASTMRLNYTNNITGHNKYYYDIIKFDAQKCNALVSAFCTICTKRLTFAQQLGEAHPSLVRSRFDVEGARRQVSVCGDLSGAPPHAPHSDIVTVPDTMTVSLHNLRMN